MNRFHQNILSVSTQFRILSCSVFVCFSCLQDIQLEKICSLCLILVCLNISVILFTWKFLTDDSVFFSISGKKGEPVRKKVKIESQINYHSYFKTIQLEIH